MNYKKIFFTLCCCFALLLSCMPCIKSPITISAATNFQRSLPEMPLGIKLKFDEYMEKEQKNVYIWSYDCTNNPNYYIHIQIYDDSVNANQYKLSVQSSAQNINNTYNGYGTNANIRDLSGKMILTSYLIIKYNFNSDSWYTSTYTRYGWLSDNEYTYFAPKNDNNGTPSEITQNILYASTDIVYKSDFSNVLRPASSGYNYFEAGGYTFSGSGITGEDIDKVDEDDPNFIGPHEFIGNGILMSRDFTYEEFVKWCIDNKKYIGLFESLGISETVENQLEYMKKVIKCWHKFQIFSFANPTLYADVYEILKSTFDIVPLNVFISKADSIYSYFNKCLEEYKETLYYIETEPDYGELENTAEEAEITSNEKGILYWVKTIYKTLRNTPSAIANSIQNKYANFVNNVENNLSSLSLNLITYSKNFNEVFSKLPKNISSSLAPSLQVINGNIKNHDDFTNKDLNNIIAAISESGGSSGTVVGGITATEIDNILGGYFGANPVGVFGAGGVMGAGGAMLNTMDGIANGINNLNSNFAFGDTSYNQHISNIDSGISDLKNIISDYKNGSSSANEGCGFEEESYFIKLHDEVEYWVVPQDIPEQEEISYLFAQKFAFVTEIRNAASYMYDIADGNVTVNSEIDTTDNPFDLIETSETVTDTSSEYAAVETVQLNSNNNFNHNTININGNTYPDTTYKIKIDYLRLDFNAKLIDFQYYNSIKPTVDKIIIGLVWGFYLFKLYARLPGIMGGEYFKQKD